MYNNDTQIDEILGTYDLEGSSHYQAKQEAKKQKTAPRFVIPDNSWKEFYKALFCKGNPC